MGRPEFAKQMFAFWRDTFKMGETAMLDTAPAFAAQSVGQQRLVHGHVHGELGQLPDVRRDDRHVHVGRVRERRPEGRLLTNPGVHGALLRQLRVPPLALRPGDLRLHEVPGGSRTTPQDVGGAAPYTGVWPFNSIASPTNGGGRINFQDTSAVICANCHSTLNHLDAAVRELRRPGRLPARRSRSRRRSTARRSRSSPTTCRLARPRRGASASPAADLPALGQAMAADPDVAECGVARMWNWALGKTDIVDTLQEVPTDTIQAQIDAFTASGFKMKDLIYAVYTSDDFVKF